MPTLQTYTAWAKYDRGSRRSSAALKPGRYFEFQPTGRQCSMSLVDQNGKHTSLMLLMDRGVMSSTARGLHKLPFFGRTVPKVVGVGITSDGMLYIRSSACPQRCFLLRAKTLGASTFVSLVEATHANFGAAKFVLPELDASDSNRLGAAKPALAAAASADAGAPRTIDDLPDDVLGRIMQLTMRASIDRRQEVVLDNPFNTTAVLQNTQVLHVPSVLARVSKRFAAVVQRENEELWRLASRAVLSVITERAPIRDWRQYFWRRYDALVKRRRYDTIANCSIEFECPLQWDNLQPTAELGVRHCDVCKENVYEVHSRQEARAHIEQQHCVALHIKEERRLMGSMVSL